MRQADVVLVLHSHMPWVLHHGRWPHGSDWLCEAVIGAYLPLIGTLRELERRDIAAPVTLSVTPVLAAQLTQPAMRQELERYFDGRLAQCDETAVSLEAYGEAALAPLAAFWRRRLVQQRLLFQELGGDLIAELRRMQQQGRLEIATSAATHAFLPLLGRDESIRLQLALARDEYARHFGCMPAGCWLPECGYRPGGDWTPLAGMTPRMRDGIEAHLEDLDFRYFIADAHMAGAGRAPDAYGWGDVPRHRPAAPCAFAVGTRDPHRDWHVAGTRGLSVFVRDPVASAQVWSRHGGYPGAAPYLEFHKIRWPGGMRLWRVTDALGDLGTKEPYEPARARHQVSEHAAHFVRMLHARAGEPSVAGRVIAVPFDTELFGHWWFEGPDFLHDVLAGLHHAPGLRAATVLGHLEAHPPRDMVTLSGGSWGRRGDYSTWLNDQTRWMWRVVWDAETRFWALAAGARSVPAARELLAQAARELLLLQASDWPFLVTTGDALSYGLDRFDRHANDLRVLLDAVQDSLQGLDVARARETARALGVRDAIFEDVLDSVDVALGARASAPAPTRHRRA